MKYLILSDIHSNLEALSAVLAQVIDADVPAPQQKDSGRGVVGANEHPPGCVAAQRRFGRQPPRDPTDGWLERRREHGGGDDCRARASAACFVSRTGPRNDEMCISARAAQVVVDRRPGRKAPGPRPSVGRLAPRKGSRYVQLHLCGTLARG